MKNTQKQPKFKGSLRVDIDGVPMIFNVPNPRLDAYFRRVQKSSATQQHGLASVTQQILYRKFAKTGQKLTWNDVETIEIQALIRAGMTKGVAAATVRKYPCY